METAGNLPFHLWLWPFRWARRNVTSTTLQRSSEVLIMSLRLTKNWPSRQAVLSSRILPWFPWVTTRHLPTCASSSLELSKATKDKYHAMSMVNLVDKKLIFLGTGIWKHLELKGFGKHGRMMENVVAKLHKLSKCDSDDNQMRSYFYSFLLYGVKNHWKSWKFHEVSTSHMNSANCRNSVSSKDALKFCTSSIMFPCGCTSLNATLMG